jgi:hypothetical protein
MSSHFDTVATEPQVRDIRELQQIEAGLRQMNHRQLAFTIQRMRAAGDELGGQVLYFKWIKLTGLA